MKLNILLLITLVTVFSESCTKVSPEDPALSLKTRKARIKNNWSLDKLFDLGNEITDSNISSISLSFTEFIGQDVYSWKTFFTDGTSFTEEGDWEIDPNDKRVIVFEQEGQWGYVGGVYKFIEGQTSRFYLLRVAKKELWLRKLDGVTCEGPNEFYFVAD